LVVRGVYQRKQFARCPLLGVLTHEHQVQGVEHWPSDVPVKVVRHEIKRVAVGEQNGKSMRDLLALGRTPMPMSIEGALALVTLIFYPLLR